ncbi:hypothetical protein AB0J63_29190 [Streptosporangium canum]|uniref:hypothetical protein n=1 Tax=Streptosporangium canum TaxID=324952 RepID=UPI0034348087
MGGTPGYGALAEQLAADAARLADHAARLRDLAARVRGNPIVPEWFDDLIDGQIARCAAASADLTRAAVATRDRAAGERDRAAGEGTGLTRAGAVPRDRAPDTSGAPAPPASPKRDEPDAFR